MIENINIKNFKSLKNISIETKSLNILMGLNGMGKSSLIQSLLVLRQSREIENGKIDLNGDLVEIGKGKDAMYQYNLSENILINFVDYVCDCYFDLKYKPESDFLESEKKYLSSYFKSTSLFNKNFQYLSAERIGPASVYDTSYSEVITNRQIGNSGQFVVHFLNAYGNEKILFDNMFHKNAKSSILLHQADAWLSEIAPGVKLNTTEIPGTEKVILDFQFETGSLYTNRFRPTNVGFGLTYVLPVIVCLLSIKKDKLIIIENPESHIHPRGQVELGKLISLAAMNGAQIFVETHSDHIINGIRLSVKEKLINKKDVCIFNFEKITTNDEQFSIAKLINIDDKGELSEYPENFMDEWSNQILKLL